MKRIIFLLFSLPFFFTACDEIAPTINPQMEVETELEDQPIDVSDQQKQILIEEFTGVNCNNCPKGSRELENLLDQFGDQLVAVSIHAGSFDNPIHPEDEILGVQEGEDLLSFLGEPLGYPTAVIDRTKFSNSFGIQLSPNSKWIGALELEILKPLVLQVGILKDYDPVTRELETCVKMFPQEDINNDDIRVTLMIIESGMIVPQKDNEAAIELVLDYEHKHVLRTTLSAATGDKILDPFTAGAELVKCYSTTLPDNWVAEKCDIIAFVSLNDGDTREVIQAEEIHVID